MRFVIGPLLSETECEEIRERLQGPEADWRPGVETAGWHARKVKNNQQLNSGSALYQELAVNLQSRLGRHPFVQGAAFPRRIHSMLFSRCEAGEGYGKHVDNPWMANGRTDLSFTLALSDPSTYKGGALVLESPNDEESFRLPIGHAIVYPSTMLHRVEPVTEGQRLVAVGWIESRIRHAEQRELLFDLDTAQRALFERSGKDEVFDLISRSYSNLLRRWDC
jgi:PKHD-type hydroxylase